MHFALKKAHLQGKGGRETGVNVEVPPRGVGVQQQDFTSSRQPQGLQPIASQNPCVTKSGETAFIPTPLPPLSNFDAPFQVANPTETLLA